MGNEIEIRVNWADKATVDCIKKTVAAGLDEQEFFLFAEYCKATKLNPLKREVWAIKTKGYTAKNGQAVDGKLQIMTGINGYLAVANSQPEFDGMQTSFAHDKDGRLLSATCAVFRKDRRLPSEVTVFLSEFFRPSFSGKPGIWDEKPHVMLAKVAKSQAIREAFVQILGGTYTEEEMPAEYQSELLQKPKPIKTIEKKQETIVEVEASKKEYLENQDKFFYKIPLDTLTPEQLKFMESQSEWNSEFSAFESKADLGPKLQKYLVKKEDLKAVDMGA